MNELILELAKQAGMQRDKFGLYWNTHDNPNDGVDLEKFAELLVQEFLLKVTGAKIRNESYAELVERIKEDFGVE